MSENNLDISSHVYLKQVDAQPRGLVNIIYKIYFVEVGDTWCLLLTVFGNKISKKSLKCR